MKYFLFLLVLPLLFFSCQKNETYPIEPVISFKSVGTLIAANGRDSMAVVIIDFTDGDGDIGLNADDTLPPFNSGSEYYRNYRMEFFEKINGVYVLNPLSSTLGGRMPYLTPKGINKALKGEIKLETNLPVQMTADTCYFNVYIYDRALHKSNIIKTEPELIINTN